MAPDDESMIGQNLVDFRNEERFARSGREPRHPGPPRVSARRVLTDSSRASRPVIYSPGFRLRTRVAVLFVAACLIAVAYLLLRVNGQA